MHSAFIHPSSFVAKTSRLGVSVRVWHFTHIDEGATIGDKTQIGQNCYVGKNVEIGKGCKIQNNNSIYTGVVFRDYVFCGPSVVFTNVVNPRANIERKHEFQLTTAEEGVSLGANSTILPGVVLGSYSFVGAGAVVLKDTLPFGVYVGSPARHIGWITRAGDRFALDSKSYSCRLSADEYVIDQRGCSLVKS